MERNYKNINNVHKKLIKMLSRRKRGYKWNINVHDDTGEILFDDVQD